MVRFKYIFLVSILVVSCVKTPITNDYVSPLVVPEDFNWMTTETKPVTISATSTIIDQNGDTVAASIHPASYSLIIGKNTQLTVIEDPVVSESFGLSANAPDKKAKDVIYFPAKNRYATVMFEDLFPSKGDMDVNDVVFGLNIEFNVDNQSRLRSLIINIEPRAIGSFYEEIGLGASLYSSGSSGFVDMISHSANNEPEGIFNVSPQSGGVYYTESGNNFDVISLTGNFRSYFSRNPELFINVREEDPFIETQNFSVLIEIKSNMIFPISQLTFLESTQPGTVNLDIFGVFGIRSKEVHFKGGKPTNYFNFAYFLSTYKNDFSTADNWVWAILSDKSIRYPLEYRKIYHAYPNFKIWAESGGTNATDWYSPSVSDSLYNKGNFEFIN